MKGVVGVGAHKRVVNEECMVRFLCPKCRGESVIDAYNGPPYHQSCEEWMIPMALVVGDRAKPFLRPKGMPARALHDPNRGS